MSNKTRHSKKILGNQSGQGAVEYILLLFIVVTLLGGGLYQFHDAFRNFSQAYFGDYLRCLLETGELPALGYEQDGICNAEFQAFSLASGRPAIPGSGSGGGSGFSGGNNSNRGSSSGGRGVGGRDSSSNSSARSGSSSGEASSRVPRGTGSGNGMETRSLGRQSPSRESSVSSDSNRLRKGRFQRVAQNKEKKDKNKKPKRRGGTANANQIYEASYANSSRLQRRYVAANLDDEELAEAREINGSNVSAGVDGAGGRSQKVPIKKKRKAASLEEAKPSLGFGDYLRYLVIAAILIAMLLFLGGQLQSISKSME
ncbi:MAG: hypothetical protein AB8E15_00630 [Bdellovibrionales bacterium]